MDADYWIGKLGLTPHPEGGYFAETYRSADRLPAHCLPGRYGGPRPCSTAIYFLLRDHQVSALHRLRSDEIWHYHAGSGGHVTVIDPDGRLQDLRIGPDAEAGECFQVMLPAGSWFGASVTDRDSFLLVGCTVAPGFSFEDFELGRREELLAEFPQHRRVIESLTRA